MKYDESSLQQWSVSYLIYYYSHLFWNHSPNEGVRSERQGVILKKSGMQPGWPDLEILHDTTVLFVEFKTPTGRQSTHQKRVQKILENMGYVYVICRTREDFIKICRKYLGKERDPDIERLKEIQGIE